MKVTKTLKNNKEIIEFYKANNTNDYKQQYANKPTLCTFNVHGWININAEIDIFTNFKNIISLLQKIDADVIILQEVCIANKISKEQIIASFFEIGYVDNFFVKNGGCFLSKTETEYLVLFSKKDIIDKIDIDISTKVGFPRHCIVCKINGINYMFVHLEIGRRYHHLQQNSSYRLSIEKSNTEIRINQLKSVLDKHQIDIIAGDFNFSPYDDEVKYLNKRGYNFFGNSSNTTPYNRTDMLFSNVQVEHTEDVLCNYSDHIIVLYWY